MTRLTVPASATTSMLSTWLRAHVIAMDRMLGGKSLDNVEIFNLGTGNGVSVLELINTFEAATGVKVPHKIVGRREGDIEKGLGQSRTCQ